MYYNLQKELLYKDIIIRFQARLFVILRRPPSPHYTRCLLAVPTRLYCGIRSQCGVNEARPSTTASRWRLMTRRPVTSRSWLRTSPSMFTNRYSRYAANTSTTCFKNTGTPIVKSKCRPFSFYWRWTSLFYLFETVYLCVLFSNVEIIYEIFRVFLVKGSKQ